MTCVTRKVNVKNIVRILFFQQFFFCFLNLFQFSPEKSRASNRLMKHTSKSARQITKSGDVYELEQGVVVDNENVLITNVTVHVVNPDDETGILMR